MLQIFNSLSKKKEAFLPIEPMKVRLYVCGMTVYDYCHLGHARVLVAFDVVVRYLRASGYQVTYVRNITDIDDKIIQRAAENGESVGELTQRFIDAMHEDSNALHVLAPDVEPKATDSVDLMLKMIQQLEAKGYAYAAGNGDVYYEVSRFSDYGKLSGKKLDELQAGARVEVELAKRSPLDFVLWKAAKPGEPAWDSPWGKGRPGWHIECSAMSTQYLGNHFDIHGGGMDLQFPHHENEIAQSEGATGCKFANYWMHNGFVRVNEEKMSKSLGNFFSIREILEKFRAEEVRYFIVNSQYRSELNYSLEHLESARAALTRLYTGLRDVVLDDGASVVSNEFTEKFNAAMDDDFNTAGALSVLHEIAHEMNRAKNQDQLRFHALGSQLKSLASILGLLQQDPNAYLQGAQKEAQADGLCVAEIEAAIEQRAQAKKAKDFAAADAIRKELADAGILLEDSLKGTSWRRGE